VSVLPGDVAHLCERPSMWECVVGDEIAHVDTTLVSHGGDSGAVHV